MVASSHTHETKQRALFPLITARFGILNIHSMNYKFTKDGKENVFMHGHLLTLFMLG